jgi:hypothetical protein
MTFYRQGKTRKCTFNVQVTSLFRTLVLTRSAVDTTCIIECCHIWDQTLETEERVMVQTPSVYIVNWENTHVVLHKFTA